MNNTEDYNLVMMALNKDSKSFETLVLKYEKLVFSIAYRMMGNKEDAEDVSQIVFIKIYNKLDTYIPGQSFKAWVGTITTNTCIDEIRKNKNKKTLSTDMVFEGEENDFSINLESKEPTPLDELLDKERRQIILESIGELKKSSRELIILRDINDLSYEDIALHLDMKLGTVKSKISRSRLKLKNIIMQKMQLLDK